MSYYSHATRIWLHLPGHKEHEPQSSTIRSTSVHNLLKLQLLQEHEHPHSSPEQNIDASLFHGEILSPLD